MNAQQRKNAEILAQVIQDKIDRNDPPEMLNSWFQPCGSMGCVAGDTYLAMGLMPEDASITARGLLSDHEYDSDFCDWLREFHYVFGFDDIFDSCGATHLFRVFGGEYDGSLQERLNYVKSQMEVDQ